MEPQKPVHRLEKSGFDRKGYRGSQGRWPGAEGKGHFLRCGLHL
ncbi:UNVERIFIED_CONTAM: hypothetical protein GTU68_052607 [Idotea baltica]|nr:hypothetical protein [Idotea baltica]